MKVDAASGLGLQRQFSSVVAVHMTSAKRVALAVVLVACFSLPVQSQARGAVLLGFVLIDSTRTPIDGAEASVPAFSKRAFTSANGRYEIDGIPAGTHEVIVRHVGFRPVATHITFAAGDTVKREILLSRVPTLEAITVHASAVIPSFEENRVIGLGSFITRAELAKQEGRYLSEILSQTRGVRILRGMGGRAWVYSSRRPVSSIMPRGRASDENLAEGALRDACYAQVYVDNQIVYRGLEHELLFNLNSISPSQIEAIEYYAGPASTPPRYSRLNSQCGVLVIHTRRTF